MDRLVKNSSPMAMTGNVQCWSPSTLVGNLQLAIYSLRLCWSIFSLPLNICFISLLVILAILGSVGHSNVQNCWCSDSSRNLGKIKFTSSKAHLLRLENLLQVIRKCCSSSMNGEAVEVGPEHDEPGGVQ